MIIRKAEEKDKEEIFKIISDEWHKDISGPSNYIVFTETKKGLIERYKRLWTEYCIYVAEDNNGKIIGFIFSYKVRDRSFISDVFVGKEYQGKDVEKQLINAIIPQEKEVYIIINNKNQYLTQIVNEMNFKSIKSASIYKKPGGSK